MQIYNKAVWFVAGWFRDSSCFRAFVDAVLAKGHAFCQACYDPKHKSFRACGHDIVAHGEWSHLANKLS